MTYSYQFSWTVLVHVILTTVFPQDPNHRKQQVSGGAGTGRRDRDRCGALQG